MIHHPRRSPVVTCAKCAGPFKMTDEIIAEAVEHHLAQPSDAHGGLNDRPVLFKCPHCGKRSTQPDLMGADVEPFDARLDNSA